MLTLGKAAKQCKVSKGTISKAIASGKLSASRREDGSWSIDGAELTRYFEEIAPSEQPETVPELRARAELAEQRLADLKAMYEDMVEQRNKWEAIAYRIALPSPKRDDTVSNTRSAPHQDVQPAGPRLREVLRLVLIAVVVIVIAAFTG